MRHSCRKALLMVASTVGFACPVFGLPAELQPGKLSIKLISTRSGLPQESITALAQTSDRFLWIGTQAGLVRYDGADMVIFNRFNTEAFVNHYVTALQTSASGDLWIGTQSGLLFRGSKGSFRRWSEADGLPGPYIRALAQDREGRIWVGTYNGGLCFIRENRVHRVPVPEEMSRQPVRSFCPDDDRGILWIGSSKGLFRYSGGVVSAVEGSPVLTGLFIRAICRDGRGGVWLGTQSQGLKHFDGHELTHPPLSGAIPRDATVWSLLRDRQGMIWAGTRGRGLVIVSDEGVGSLDRSDGLSSNIIWSLLEDAEGEMWVGTRSGLCQLRCAPVISVDAKLGLADDFVLSVYQDDTGAYWVGSEKGLDRWDEWPFKLPLHRRYLDGFQVRSLLKTTDGVFWAGTRRGLFRKIGESFKRVEAVKHRPETVVNALAEDRQGCLWVGTSDSGLHRLCRGAADELIAELPNPVVRALHQSPDGRMWIGTEGGLVCIDGESRQVFTRSDGLPGNQIFTIFEDDQGILWVGCDNGLGILQGGNVTSAGMDQGLLVDFIFSILEDQMQNIWLGSPEGIIRLSRGPLQVFLDHKESKLRLRVFDEADGLVSHECNGASEPSAWEDGQGRLFFATRHGLSSVDVRALETLPIPDQPIITEVGNGKENVPTDQPILFNPDDPLIEINYTVPEFRSSHAIRYRYRMNGRPWVEMGARKTLSFSNLNPGLYSVEVQAGNLEDDWNRNSTSLNFRVLPHFWQQPAVMAIAAALLLCLVWLLHRFRLRQASRRAEKLDRLVKEKTLDLEKANRKLQEFAMRDGLTGVPNRRSFEIALESEWRRHQRSGLPLALIILDIDFFKQYNDRYGHLAGDDALKIVATAFAERLNRPGDHAARYGGEEFVGLLAESSLEGALRLAEGIRRGIAELKIPHGNSSVADYLTVSIGVASTVPDIHQAPNHLVMEADRRVYEAKKLGRNRISPTLENSVD